MRQHQTAATSMTTPLPARNLNTAKMGVALNPKVAGHDKDKSDRATQDQVLDGRTKLVLSGLTNRGIIGKLERCISTGKEANVYLSGDRAVKIYRTSILNFRSRREYIEGEFRFKGEYTSSKNPRKMVRVWAEKELRNLKRLKQGGVRVPEVYECKENVLVMDYLGGEEAAPRLKDTDVDDECYKEVLEAMRQMYQRCRLVHADLSEYNILLYQGQPWIIDVSQSVEHDHPQSLEFLRMDISNIKRFFEQQGATVLSLKQMWDYVTSETVSPLEDTVPDDADDAVFMASFIPRSLNEVYDPERDAEKVQAGQADELIYAGLTGLKDVLPKLADTQNSSTAPSIQQEENQKSIDRETITEDEEADLVAKSVRFEDDEYEEEDSDRETGLAVNSAQRPRGHRHEDKDAKKVRDALFVLYRVLNDRRGRKRSRKRIVRRGKTKCLNQIKRDWLRSQVASDQIVAMLAEHRVVCIYRFHSSSGREDRLHSGIVACLLLT